MTWLTADSTNEVEMASPASRRSPVVRDGAGVGGEVAAELADRLGQLARLDDGVGEVGGEVVDGLPGTEDVAVPEEPLHPLQLGSDVGRRLGCAAQALGQLGQHGDPHREVEPVQQVLGLRIGGSGVGRGCRRRRR